MILRHNVEALKTTNAFKSGGKAARLVEQMEDEGVVSSANHVGKREILVPEQQ